MMVSNRNLLFQGFIFRFHVSFPGCTLNYIKLPNLGSKNANNMVILREVPYESAWFWVVTYFFGGIKECKYVTPPKFNMTSPLEK